MPKVAPVIAPIPDVLKALSDEMRWSIVSQMSEVEELACIRLEQTLPVSKPTISYHIKVLYHAGLVEIRKEGRNYYYKLRREVLDSVLSGVAEQLGLTVAPTSRRAAAISRGTRSAVATSGTTRSSRSAAATGATTTRTRSSRSTATAGATRSTRTGAADSGHTGRAARAARSA
jgi:DNA-binding transcriptional ArsR family regulator